jgi:condensin complex subunit 1
LTSGFFIVEKQANSKTKEREELEQVAGNAEDEIGERIAGVRETELLYGPQSLLAVYGPMLVHVCGSLHKYKVSRPNWKKMMS